MSDDELDQRLRWLSRYPDVALQRCATGGAAEYLITHNEPIQLLVSGSADAHQLTRFVGPHRHPFVAHPECSVLLVRH
jgi:hypothetical protein